MLSLCSDDYVTNQLLLISQALCETMFVMCTCKRLYINFIHGHIHGWSCENTCYPCERNMGCIFVSSNLLYILHFSLPCCRQHYTTLNYITLELNMCNVLSMAAHPSIKVACVVPHGFYCELRTNNSSSIIHRTAVDMKWLVFLHGTDINVTLSRFKLNFKSILLIVVLKVHYVMSETKLEHRPDIELTTDTPHIGLTGKLWVVCCQYWGENRP